MSNDLLGLGVALWLLAALLALAVRPAIVARVPLALGSAATAAGAVLALPAGGDVTHLPLGVAGAGLDFVLKPSAAWLLFFGLIPATLAAILGTPSSKGRTAWCFGAASGLIGAVGVFGLQDGFGLLVAWELMSLGGAVMILS
ncbi:MAG TPA: hypothetical protein VME40_18060, partial [Caulobacteraceae bacterium]|nr:hypothetical protein [Caulobacteraceae bacterium]